jgi:selenocysteine-specific elongation factor
VRSIVVGTAGHIDHGKSALVQALTGTDPDRLKEEKARGITIDLGFAHLQIGDTNVAFVDVPGHERFVKNMLAGVGGIDLVLLVVAADESVMPQTREHFDICRLLHIPTGIVALTKADLADAEMLELTRVEVRELVENSFLAGAPVVPVSARTGQGLDELRTTLVAAAGKSTMRRVEGSTRLPIDRVFSVKGFGTVVTGTLVSGRIRPDDRLLVAPDAGGGRAVTVRGVQVHGARQNEALAGQRSAVNLSGVDVGDLERGHTLVSPGTFESTRVADAAIELLPGAKPLRHGARVRFHQGTAEIMGRVAVIGPAPTPVAPGGRAFVRLRLERPAILARGDRYIVRAYSPPLTIAGGTILDPLPPRAGVRTSAASERLWRLAAEDPTSVGGQTSGAVLMIEEAGRKGFPVDALVSRVGIDRRDLEARIASLVKEHGIDRVDDMLVRRAIVDELKASIVALLDQYHRAQPLSEGFPREEARDRLFLRGHPAIFERAVQELAQETKILARDRLARAGHRVALSEDEERARDAIERALRDAGLTPPDAASLAARTGVSAAVADQMLKLLQRQKRLVKIDTLFFHDDALTSLKAQVAALKSGGGAATIDVATFKERFGVTRKFAIPLLEYLDRERVTRRVGDVRQIL